MTKYDATLLRWLADSYYQVQKTRIAVGNRKKAVERQVDLGPLPAPIASIDRALAGIENQIAKDMEVALAGHPAMEWLGRVNGVGARLAAKTLGLIGDIGTFDTVSKLWRFSGYAVIDGVRERPVKGELLHYNIRLKTTLYLIAKSFVMNRKSAYRPVYDRARVAYNARPLACETHAPKPDYKCPKCWPPLHSERAAYRKVVKLFVAHLWQTWREAEGLPVRVPYVLEHGHTTFLDPWDFVKPRAR